MSKKSIVNALKNPKLFIAVSAVALVTAVVISVRASQPFIEIVADVNPPFAD